MFKAMVTWLDAKRQERLHHASDLMVTVRLPLLSPSTIVDSIESVTHLMDIPDCLKLVKEALHYHCMPARQSMMQVCDQQLDKQMSTNFNKLTCDVLNKCYVKFSVICKCPNLNVNVHKSDTVVFHDKT